MGASREKGERRTVEVRKEAHRPRREPPALHLCSAVLVSRAEPSHIAVTAHWSPGPVMLLKKKNSLESRRELHRYCLLLASF